MLIFAHRGACVDAPENTISAIKEAFDQKADGVEIDVRKTLDNKIVAVHDRTFFKTTGKRVQVKKCHSEEIKYFDAGFRKHERFCGEKVPFIEDILEAVPCGKLLQLHIKGAGQSPYFILDAIKKSHKKIEEIMILSSKYSVLQEVNQLDKHIFTGLVYGSRPIIRRKLPPIHIIVEKLKKVGAKALAFDCRLDFDKKDIDLLHKSGIKAYSWTIDDRNTALRLKDFGADAITVNRPAYIRQAIDLNN